MATQLSPSTNKGHRRQEEPAYRYSDGEVTCLTLYQCDYRQAIRVAAWRW